MKTQDISEDHSHGKHFGSGEECACPWQASQAVGYVNVPKGPEGLTCLSGPGNVTRPVRQAHDRLRIDERTRIGLPTRITSTGSPRRPILRHHT